MPCNHNAMRAARLVTSATKRCSGARRFSRSSYYHQQESDTPNDDASQTAALPAKSSPVRKHRGGNQPVTQDEAKDKSRGFKRLNPRDGGKPIVRMVDSHHRIFDERLCYEPAAPVTHLLDGTRHNLDPVYLRDSCQCPLCKDMSTTQKLFETASIPLNIRGVGITSHGHQAGESGLTWSNDVPGYSEDHVTRHDPEFLNEVATSVTWKMIEEFGKKRYWGRPEMEAEQTWIDYHDYMQEDSVLLHALEELHSHGLVFLRGIPDNEGELEHNISGRIGSLRRTFYGDTWDVKSVANAKNVAYTDQHLGLHMDLLYMRTPPHLQLLHSLRARASGGASIFVDSFRVAYLMRAKHPEEFTTLRDTNVPYEYRNDGHHYHRKRKTFETSFGGTKDAPRAISGVNWSPPFQGTFPPFFGTAEGASHLRKYIKAAARFVGYLEEPLYRFEHRLEEGECVIFDNRRVLHGRTKFDASTGDRWLKGCYIDEDVYHSKLRVLQKKFPAKQQNVAEEVEYDMTDS